MLPEGLLPLLLVVVVVLMLALLLRRETANRVEELRGRSQFIMLAGEEDPEEDEDGEDDLPLDKTGD